MCCPDLPINDFPELAYTFASYSGRASYYVRLMSGSGTQIVKEIGKEQPNFRALA